jgi:dolichol-phosphate mannosyltransferase
MPPERALVVVPTYNESDSIGIAIDRLFAAADRGVDVLVIDDSSPDGTAKVVAEISESDRRVHLLNRPSKQGLGTAYVTGFGWAMERDYPAVVEMDADLSHDPADVPRLLAALEDADLAIGSRYVEGGEVKNWGRFRRALSGFGNFYARLWLGFDVRDSTSGFRAYRTELLTGGLLDDVRSEGYAFQIEMARRVRNAGGRIAEVPITFVERAAGKSKMSKRIVIEALISVTRWGIEDLRAGRRRP